MTVRIAPDARMQFFDSQGNVLAGGLLFTYAAGTTTPRVTYTDSTGNVANATKIVLDAAGRTPNGVWLTEGLLYKFVLAPANDTTPPASPIWTEDNIQGINDANLVLDQWIAFGSAPTYVSATSFTLVGDQTGPNGAFQVGRRLKFSVTAGTVYAEISAATFAASLTTVTVAFEDGTTLDAGLTAVSYSLLSTVNDAMPRGVSVGGEQDIASATTTAIGSLGTENLRITGVTTITGFGTANKGIMRRCRMAGALTLTHNATSLILPSGANITTAAGDVFEAISLGSGNWYVTAYTKASGAAVLNPVMRNYIAGLTMSTAGSSQTMTIAAGQAADSTNVALMSLAASINKTTSAWAVGTGNGGLDTGAIANSTWYHFFLIQRPDTGVVDVLISLSPTAPTMPANYTLFRRIGSGRTNGSAQWTSFTQNGNRFRWATPVLDVSATSFAAYVTTTITAPTGVAVLAFGNVNSGTGGSVVNIRPVGASDGVAAYVATPLGTVGSTGNNGGTWSEYTNTSAQISISGNTTTNSYLTTAGWYDNRGTEL